MSWAPPFDKLVPAVPERPPLMTPAGVAVWDVVAPRLHARGVLTCVDGPALALLCELRALVAKARARGSDARELRLVVRDVAADFLVIPRERVSLAVVDGQGEDADLAWLFDGSDGAAAGPCRDRETVSPR